MAKVKEPSEKADKADKVEKAAPIKITPAVDHVVSIRVMIRGMVPGLLMSSKGGMVAEEARAKQTVKPTRETQAHNAAYWTEVSGKPQLALPWDSLYKSIVEAAKRFRYKGRESLRTIVAATIACPTPMIPLGTDKYEIDSRWGRIPPKTGGTVMLNRALLPKWEADFTLLVDAEFYDPKQIYPVLQTAGKLVGVCANRPQLIGPYGKFTVEKWEGS